ncbi:cupin domain-containing protein [Pseudomonas sp. UL073]|uniref:Cupin domain-containing protein n=1 Tax=Zestomonas insulae TaxID=2809017 RepID=A0ABS2ICC5_9GAMM|nr:cupin domain-containing protein [Pseudomonas insulae]MBM7060602.1 cupin domain-containing protein [Pseudomonas insulae]
MRSPSVWMCAALFSLASGVALAHGGAGDETVTPVAEASLPATPSANAKALRVEFAPGASSKPHSHPGPVFVVVVSGEVESALDGGPVQRYQAGDAWYEAPGQLHRVTRNASQSAPATLVAWLLSDGKTPLVTPQPAQ